MENEVITPVQNNDAENFGLVMQSIGSVLEPMAREQANAVIATQRELTERAKLKAELEKHTNEFNDKELLRNHKGKIELSRWILGILVFCIAGAFWREQYQIISHLFAAGAGLAAGYGVGFSVGKKRGQNPDDPSD